MIDPMIYGIILNQDSFENLMELREMTETGIMRMTIQEAGSRGNGYGKKRA